MSVPTGHHEGCGKEKDRGAARTLHWGARTGGSSGAHLLCTSLARL